MRPKKGKAVQLKRTLMRMFGLLAEGNGITKQLVYRAVEVSAVQDPWERRIIELGEGRSIGEITEILYREEIRSGAWAADIGLWKSVFAECVVNDIVGLVSLRHIRLISGDISYDGRSIFSQTGDISPHKRNCGSGLNGP